MSIRIDETPAVHGFLIEAKPWRTNHFTNKLLSIQYDNARRFENTFDSNMNQIYICVILKQSCPNSYSYNSKKKKKIYYTIYVPNLYY